MIHKRMLGRLIEKEKRARNDIVKALTIIRFALYDAGGDFCFRLCVIMFLNNSNSLNKSKFATQNKKLNNLRKLFGVFKFDVKNIIMH